jgi:K+-sensing histidine kinase KdpD
MKARIANAALASSVLLLCAAAAWSVSQFGWQNPHRLALPFLFLGVVLALGVRYGRAVGILGSIISALIFAHALYQPVGSFFVADQAARSALAWAVLVGVTISFLLLPTGEEVHHRKSHTSHDERQNSSPPL